MDVRLQDFLDGPAVGQRQMLGIEHDHGESGEQESHELVYIDAVVVGGFENLLEARRIGNQGLPVFFCHALHQGFAVDEIVVADELGQVADAASLAIDFNEKEHILGEGHCLVKGEIMASQKIPPIEPRGHHAPEKAAEHLLVVPLLPVHDNLRLGLVPEDDFRGGHEPLGFHFVFTAENHQV